MLGACLQASWESFIAKNYDKYALLWRELYTCEDEQGIPTLLKEGCQGIVRCLKGAEKLRHLMEIAPTPTPNWEVVSENVAIEDKNTSTSLLTIVSILRNENIITG